MNPTNFLNEFNTGGSHAENSLGGIPQGTGANGKPNTVEEGETRAGDYVFSDRLLLDEKLIAKHGLPKRFKGKTPAWASKELNKHFKESDNKIDKDTTKEMLERLTNASEEVRIGEEINNLSDENKMFLGGLLGGEKGDSFSEASEASLEDAGPAEFLGGATALAGFGQEMFGDTGIDMSGQQRHKKVSGAASAASSTLTGAGAGAEIAGPWGAAIGGSIGLVSGLIGADKKNKDIRQANKAYDLESNSKYSNDFAKGGNMYGNGGPFDLDFIIDSVKKAGQVPNLTGSSEDLHDPSFNQIQAPGTQPEAQTPGFNPGIDLHDNGARSSAEQTGVGESLSKAGENYGNILRYAPVAANAGQLLSLKKPEQESLDRLGNRYKPDYVDERSLMNTASEAYNTAASSLKNASNSSVGALRSNLLAAHLNRQKGLSQSFMNAENINRGENRTKQQFDLNVDRTNLGQSNREKDINARNRAAYDTNKSSLIAQLGTDIGNIGLEEMRKKYPERLDLLYDYLGKLREEPKTT